MNIYVIAMIVFFSFLSLTASETMLKGQEIIQEYKKATQVYSLDITTKGQGDSVVEQILSQYDNS
jgi:hypothetical protein